MKLVPSLKQLEYLVSLARTLHFGQASDLCSVTPSTLSAGRVVDIPLPNSEVTIGITIRKNAPQNEALKLFQEFLEDELQLN